jgi:tripartite-type tricarboxylate transporter receptor subunit TctC
MSSLDKAMKNLKFDKRMTEINLNNSQLTKEELKKYLEQLPDLAQNVDLLNMMDSDSDSEQQDPH